MSLEKNGDLLGLLRMVSASHGGVTLKQIGERFGIDHRTAQRWKNRLLETFSDVEVVKGVGGDREHRFRLRAAAGGPADVSADQLAAIDMAIAALGPETKEAAELRRLSDEVKAHLPRAKLARVETDHDALLEAQGYVARPGPKPFVDPRVDAAVSEALKASSKVSFAYAPGEGAPVTTRRVAPLGILAGLRRYLVALQDGSANVRTYRLDRIADARVLDEAFERPHGFDLQAFARRGFGAFITDADYGEVVWRFAPKAADRARGYRFHPDQILEDAADGSLIVRFIACGHLEMAWHLYSWGDTVEVLEPPALRKMVDGYRRSDVAAMP